MKKKLLSVLLSTAMVAALLAGCGSKTETAATGDTATTEEAADAAEEADDTAEEAVEAAAAE